MLSRPRSPIAVSLAIAFATTFILTTTAFAQTTAPAAPTVTPAPTCDKPGDPPSASNSELGKAAGEMKRSTWNKNMRAYLECLKAFITEHQTAAAPHIRAANSAVEEYNKATTLFNAQLDLQTQ
jgi:hypothetical protein